MSLDERRLTEWMHGSVDGLHHPDRWGEVPGQAAMVTRRRRARLVAAGGIAAAAAVIAIVVGVTPSKSPRHHVQVGHEPTPATSLTPSPNTSPPTATTPPPSDSQALPAGYLPLFPFTSAAQVAQWKNSPSFSDYLDPGRTALDFALYLSYPGIDHVVAVRSAPDGDHVSIGFTIPGAPPHTAAIIHLVRFGHGDAAPWEVVGTDDTTFTLTSPPYGSQPQTPLTVGGSITGVDESITVKAFVPGSGSLVADSCCHPAGGTNSPWTVQIPGPLHNRGILIIAASTGGHITQVERFAVTGVRLASG